LFRKGKRDRFAERPRQEYRSLQSTVVTYESEPGMRELVEILARVQASHEFSECLSATNAIEGWLQPIEGYTLFLLAKNGPGAGAVVEIGSFKGRSTAFLAMGSKQAGREPVTAIDHFRGSPEHQPGTPGEVQEVKELGSTFATFRRNLQAAGLWDHVVPIEASSEQAAGSWDRPIRLLFIDGDHSYESSRNDFIAFERFVVPGGIVCFHDIGNCEGVTRFYNQSIVGKAGLFPLFQAGTLAVVQKTSP
jgi:predicted O-methyltransferase YrrM